MNKFTFNKWHLALLIIVTIAVVIVWYVPEEVMINGAAVQLRAILAVSTVVFGFAGVFIREAIMRDIRSRRKQKEQLRKEWESRSWGEGDTDGWKVNLPVFRDPPPPTLKKKEGGTE